MSGGVKSKTPGRLQNNTQGKTSGRAAGALSVARNAFAGRDAAILVIFIVLAVVLCWRLFTLTVVEAKALSDEGTQTRTTQLTLTARRGTIYDRNGNVLATSVDAVTIYANPSEIADPKKTATILQQILGGNVDDYYNEITANPQSTFVYIAKKVDPGFKQKLLDANQQYYEQEVAAIQAEGNDVPADITTPLTGIDFLPDTRREYPNGNIGAQVIGAVDDDGVGISGLELTYDSILRGVDGSRTVEQAKQISDNSAPLPMIDSVVDDQEPVDGSDIIVSLDIEMQQYLEQNLLAVATQRNCADDASAILLDGSTGEIYATASLPLYDRDNVTAEQIANGATTAKSITQPYEPGSTFKSVIASIAVETGLMTPDTTIYCPSQLQIYDKVVQDSVSRPSEDLSLRDIISHSSNVGVSLIEQQVGDQTFYDYLQKIGIGDYTHVDYPGETPGALADVNDWTPIQAANMAFGQGLEVSQLQMASIYGAIANNGVMVQPHFLIARPQDNVDITYPSKRIFEAQTTQVMEDMLRSDVTDGYGTAAAVNGFDAVGKTGTAEIGDLSGGYASSVGKYICSFVGYLDNSTSNLVFMSCFNNPTNYANSPATTFFSVVMTYVANLYDIQPQVEAPVTDDTGDTSAAASSDAAGTATTDSSATATSDSSAGSSASSSSSSNSSISSSSIGSSSSSSPPSSGTTAAANDAVIPSPTPRPGIDWTLDTSG